MFNIPERIIIKLLFRMVRVSYSLYNIQCSKIEFKFKLNIQNLIFPKLKIKLCSVRLNNNVISCLNIYLKTVLKHETKFVFLLVKIVVFWVDRISTFGN